MSPPWSSWSRALAHRVVDGARWDIDPVWRHVVNGPDSRAFRRNPPALAAEARRMLVDLRRVGVAATTLEALTGDAGLLPRLQELAREQEDRVAAERAVTAAHSAKPFLVELYDTHRPKIAPESLLVTTALDDQLKGLVDSYFGLVTRVTDINIWRNRSGAPTPTSSQLWHRDLRTDRVLVKAFLYLDDVGPDNGPFRYALGTQPGGSLRSEPPSHFDGINQRVLDEDAAGLRAREHAFVGPAGSLVVADVLGFHRGGFVEQDSRFLLQFRYSSRASRRLNRLALPDGVGRASVPAGLAYA